MWKDGKWNRDTISLNGIMYEVAPGALQHPNPLESREITESQVIAILDFQKYIMRRFGSIRNAWDHSFDADHDGIVNFTEFGLGCKAAGYVGNASRLWAAFDQDLSGTITVEELDMDAEGLLAKVRKERKAGGVPTDTVITARFSSTFPSALSNRSLTAAPAHLGGAW